MTYREPAAVPRPEIVVRIRPSVGAFAMLTRAAAVAFVGVSIGVFFITELTSAAAILIAASLSLASLLYRHWRRERAFILRLDGPALVVHEAGLVRSRIPLAQLRDVRVEGGDGAAAVVLVADDPLPAFALGSKLLSHAECIEFAATIRAFLDANGWSSRPDERPV